MTDTTKPYQTINLSSGRRVMANMLDISWPKHSIYGLLEVDVTAPRRIIAAHKARTGESISFTGYLAYCLARAIAEDKSLQAYRKGRKQIVIFDDVDVGLMVEGQVDGKPALMGHVVRAANDKSVLDIHREIRQVQTTPVPRGRGLPGWFRRAMLLPWPFSRLFGGLIGWYLARDPATAVAMGGTVSITAVGMFGRGHSGWALAPTPQPLSLAVGSITRKPAYVGDTLEPRDILHLTIMFDHDLVDGGPAARFTKRLVELVEAGCGLEAVAEERG